MLNPTTRLRRMLYGTLSGALLAPLIGCSPLTLVNELTPSGSVEIERDVAYGPAGRQRLDVYRPAEAEDGAPVVVYFYGGSWRSGSRTNYRFVGQSLGARGMITVIPDYRIYPDVRFPAFVEDGARALAWVAANIDEAANGVVLLGHSAGAHLAALLTLDRTYLDAFALEETFVRGMIGLAGPYAFDPLDYRKTRPIFAGLPDPDAARPITYACAASPPLLLLHGAEDGLVLPVNSRTMHARRLECGAESRYTELDDVGHFDIVLGLSDSFAGFAPVLTPIEEFIAGLGGGEKTGSPPPRAADAGRRKAAISGR